MFQLYLQNKKSNSIRLFFVQADFVIRMQQSAT